VVWSLQYWTIPGVVIDRFKADQLAFLGGRFCAFIGDFWLIFFNFLFLCLYGGRRDHNPAQEVRQCRRATMAWGELADREQGNTKLFVFKNKYK
jgi:hypothetical protein